jgi:hypothetical protein
MIAFALPPHGMFQFRHTQFGVSNSIDLAEWSSMVSAARKSG